MSISDYNRTKIIEVASVLGTPSISTVLPLLISSGDDSTTGGGEIILNWLYISEQKDIAIYDNNDNLLDYYFESFDSSNEKAVIWVYKDWERDGSAQLKIAYGKNDQGDDKSVSAGVVFDKESNLRASWLLNESSGNVLDATSNSYSLSDKRKLLGDGAWTIHTKPVAIYYNNATYFTWINSTGDVGISKINHATNEITSTTLHASFEVDDHSNPSVQILSSGKIVCFYTRHPGNEMYWRISSNSEDISSFDVEKSFSGVSTATYTQPVLLDNGDLILFYRSNGWCYRKSTDSCDSFGSEYKMISLGSWFYCHPITDGSKIYFAGGDYRVVPPNIYAWYYDSGNFYKSDGTLICNETELPIISFDDLTLVDDRENPLKLYDIALDENDNPCIAYTEHVELGVDYRARWAKWNGSEWILGSEIVAMGGAVAESHYYEAGLILDKNDPNNVYVSVETSTDVFEIFKYSTDDNGSTWTNEGKLNCELSDKNFWAKSVYNNNGYLEVLWRVGEYVTYTNYDNEILGYPSLIMGATGKVNSAYEFIGIDEFCQSGDSEPLGGLTSMSVSLWVYHNSITNDDHDIIVKGQHASSNPFVLWRDEGSPDCYSVLITDDNDDYSGVLQSDFEPLLDTWTHIVVTFEGGNNIKMYFNSSEDTGSPFSVPLVGEIADNSEKLFLGTNSLLDKIFNGIIDDIRIYNKILSEDEIQALYDSSKTSQVLFDQQEAEGAVYLSDSISQAEDISHSFGLNLSESLSIEDSRQKIKFCEANTAKSSKYGTFVYGQRVYGKNVTVCEELLTIEESILTKLNDAILFGRKDAVSFSESLEIQVDFKLSLNESVALADSVANSSSLSISDSMSIAESTSKESVLGLSDSVDFSLILEIDTTKGTPIKSEWKFIVKNPSGDQLASLTNAQDRWFVQRLNDHSEAGFVLDADDAKCNTTILDLGKNELYIYFNEVLMWGGQLVAANKIVSGDNVYWKVLAKDWVALLSKRFIGVEAIREFTTIDAGTIAWTVIDEAQDLTYGDFGITLGTIEASITRSPIYDKKNILSLIKELSNQGDEGGSDTWGFDFEITPSKVFNVYYPYRGTIKEDVVFRYPGNIEKFNASVDSWGIINHEWGMGKHWTGVDALVSRSDATSQAEYKRREAIKNYSDVSVLNFLQDLVWQDIQWNKDLQTTISFEARVDQKVEINDYNVGDGVTIICDAFDISEWLWVYERKVEIDDNDVLKVSLTVGN